jgi:hypothetical protein
MTAQLGRLLYWGVSSIAVVSTIYLEAVLGPEAIAEGDLSALLLILILGFLIWSVGLAMSRLLAGR